LKLTEHHPDARAEEITVAKPRVLDDHFTVSAFLGKNAIEVIRKIFREWRARKQLDQIRRLEVEARVVAGGAGKRIGLLAFASLHIGLHPNRERRPRGQREPLVSEV